MTSPPAPRLKMSQPGPAQGLPLTPPLTPTSTSTHRTTDSDAASYNTFDLSAFSPYASFRTTTKWDSSVDFPRTEPVLERYRGFLPSPTSPGLALARPRAKQSPSRFLFVGGVPKDATPKRLKRAFLACGDIKGIFVRFQADHGVIFLAFYDIRHTLRAHHQINTSTFFDGTRLEAHFISAEALCVLIGQSNLVSENNGSLRITMSPAGPGGHLDGPTLQNVLASFGELRAFGVVDSHAKAYYAEFFDTRDAASALDALDAHVILHERLHLTPYTAPLAPAPFPAPAPEDSTPSTEDSQQQNTSPFPTAPRLARRLSVDSLLPFPVAHEERNPPAHRSRRMSNTYNFDAVGKAPNGLLTPPRPRSISVAREAAGLGLVDVDVDGAAGQHVPEQRGREPSTPPSALVMRTIPQHTHAKRLQEHNKVDIGRIERGEVTRTTIMLKNIPNKMSDRDLIKFIDNVAPRKIDFLYLRMDFTNGCNVGYAFVNFIHVEDLLYFAKAKLGTKWNLFSSQKILGMSYANYQGKAALIDKFRSSSVMDQREAWRPKVFYSTGPKTGLPEEFPAAAPTRKERGGQLPHDLRTLLHHPPDAGTVRG